jgi:hypothetical protein
MKIPIRKATAPKKVEQPTKEENTQPAATEESPEPEVYTYSKFGITYMEDPEGNQALTAKVQVGQKAEEYDVEDVQAFFKRKSIAYIGKKLRKRQRIDQTDANKLFFQVAELRKQEAAGKAKQNVGEVLEQAGVKAQTAEPPQTSSDESKGEGFKYNAGNNYKGIFLQTECKVKLLEDNTVVEMLHTDKEIEDLSTVEVTLFMKGKDEFIASYVKTVRGPVIEFDVSPPGEKVPRYLWCRSPLH